MIHGDVSADLHPDDLLAAHAAPRRRGHHPRRDDPRRRGAAAAGRDDASSPSASGPAIGRPSGIDRADRCGRRRRVRGERPDQPGRALAHRAQPQRGAARPVAAQPARSEPRPSARRVRPGVRAARNRPRRPHGRRGDPTPPDHRPQLAPQARRDRARDPALRRPRPVAEHDRRSTRRRSRSTVENQPDRHVPAQHHRPGHRGPLLLAVRASAGRVDVRGDGRPVRRPGRGRPGARPGPGPRRIDRPRSTVISFTPDAGDRRARHGRRDARSRSSVDRAAAAGRPDHGRRPVVEPSTVDRVRVRRRSSTRSSPSGPTWSSSRPASASTRTSGSSRSTRLGNAGQRRSTLRAADRPRDASRSSRTCATRACRSARS